MSDDRVERQSLVTSKQQRRHVGERRVLGIFIRNVIGTFQLDPDRIVVATSPTTVTGLTGVPRASVERDELRDRTVPVDKQMGRDTNAGKVRKARVRAAVQTVRKESLHVITAKFAGR